MTITLQPSRNRSLLEEGERLSTAMNSDIKEAVTKCQVCAEF